MDINSSEVCAEYAYLSLREVLANALHESGITYEELEKKAGCPAGTVKQALSGAQEHDVRWWAKMLWHCGYTLEVDIRPLQR